MLIMLCLAVGIFEAINIAAVYPILDSAFELGAKQDNLLLEVMYKAAAFMPLEDEFLAFCVIFIVIALVAFFLKLTFTKMKIALSVKMVEEKQNAVFEKLKSADYQYFLDSKQGELLYAVTGAPLLIANLIRAVTNLTQTSVLAGLTVMILLPLSWQGTLAVGVFGISYIIFSRYLGKRVSYRRSTVEVETLKESNVILNEFISGIQHVKTFAVEESWSGRFKQNLHKFWGNYAKRVTWAEIPSIVLLMVLYTFVGGAALVIKLSSTIDFTEAIPVFGTFAFALFRLFPLIGNVGHYIMEIMTAIPNCEVVYNAMCEKTSLAADGGIEKKSFNRLIEFRSINFSHKGRQNILKNINLTIKKGERVALVGRSGAGKTTIINLLLKLFEAKNGEILIDETPLSSIRRNSWLSMIGYVSQEAFIINDTIGNNITFRSGGYGNEDVEKAARLAGADEFIKALPDGYDTLVGDRGMKLSGGQRQRIAIARAIIKKPEIMIFDEATNSLDNVSEVLVQKAIDKISKNRTVITIAHRLTTVENSDRIYLFENGEIAEEGEHKELLKKLGAYYRLYERQIKDTEERALA